MQKHVSYIPRETAIITYQHIHNSSATTSHLNAGDNSAPVRARVAVEKYGKWLKKKKKKKRSAQLDLLYLR